MVDLLTMSAAIRAHGIESVMQFADRILKLINDNNKEDKSETL